MSQSAHGPLPKVDFSDQGADRVRYEALLKSLHTVGIETPTTTSRDAEVTTKKPLTLEEVPLPEFGGFSHELLDPGFKAYQRQRYEAHRREVEEQRVMMMTRAEVDEDYQTQLIELCKRDPRFFVDYFAWTYDDRSDDGAIPFVLYDFQVTKMVEPYVSMVRTRAPQRATVGFAKSRAVGFTWGMLVLRVWAWSFLDNWSILIGAQNRDDVDDGGQNASHQSLFGKMRFLIDHLPKWMKMRLYGPMLAKEEYNKRMLLQNPLKPQNVMHGKQLGGMFGRSRRYSEVFADEVAWSDEMEEADTSLKQTTNRFFFGSTPKGKANFFYQVMFGDLKLTRVYCWWAENPYLDLAWYNAQRQDMTDDAIAQELDISFERSAGGRVLHEVTIADWFTPRAAYDPHLDLEVIIDPGFADHLAIIWVQWDYADNLGRVVDFVQTNRVSIDWAVPFILGRVPTHTYRGDPWPHDYNPVELDIISRHADWHPPQTVFGDKAGGAKSIVTASSAWDEMDRYGIFVAEIAVTNDQEALRKLELFMRHVRFSQHLVEQRNAHKDQSPTMAEVVTQWRYPQKSPNATHQPTRPVHDINSHGGDCLKMWAWEKDLPDASQQPASAGRVVRNRPTGILRSGYQSPFRSR